MQPQRLVIRGCQHALDKEITDLRGDGERIAIGDDQVRQLPRARALPLII
jgi:hypothetical protein